MNIEADIRKFIIKEKKSRKNYFTTAHITLYASIALFYFSPVWAVIGLSTSLIAIEIQTFIGIRRHPMPKEWIDMINVCPRVSKRGLLFLSMMMEKKGFLSIKNAEDFIDIEVEERIALRSEGKPITSLSDEANRLLIEFKELRAIERKNSWFGKMSQSFKDYIESAVDHIAIKFPVKVDKLSKQFTISKKAD